MLNTNKAISILASIENKDVCSHAKLEEAVIAIYEISLPEIAAAYGYCKNSEGIFPIEIKINGAEEDQPVVSFNSYLKRVIVQLKDEDGNAFVIHDKNNQGENIKGTERLATDSLHPEHFEAFVKDDRFGRLIELVRW